MNCPQKPSSLSPICTWNAMQLSDVAEDDKEAEDDDEEQVSADIN